MAHEDVERSTWRGKKFSGDARNPHGLPIPTRWGYVLVVGHVDRVTLVYLISGKEYRRKFDTTFEPKVLRHLAEAFAMESIAKQLPNLLAHLKSLKAVEVEHD